MSEKKLIYVNEKTFGMMAWMLGYVPENLEINRHLPDNDALIVENDFLMQKRFYINVDTPVK